MIFTGMFVIIDLDFQVILFCYYLLHGDTFNACQGVTPVQDAYDVKEVCVCTLT